ncbi:sensor histidine kinase [Sunxiuqinia sp. sy24]|uniref:sensor histidine kinase n=1 Tax=Sunxiuqinia sp. sy24 TaxID=3461495 RepID=UPI0040460D62
MPKGRRIFLSFGDLILASISIAIGTSIRGTRGWLVNEKQLKEIENQKLVAELSYLKAQINPHFFFNTLNGIYALARKKSDQTPEVILKLSDLMRYIIYEANASRVLLKREINHIENYIDLQRIRLNEMVKVHFQVKGNPGTLQIEPLLFSVFLENAFKHGVDYSKPGSIEITLTIETNQVIFTVENPIQANKKESGCSDGGVGLANIKQRLGLVYPNRHRLKIYKKNERHIVELYLNIISDEMYHN